MRRRAARAWLGSAVACGLALAAPRAGAGHAAADAGAGTSLRGQVALLRQGAIWALDLGTRRARLLVRDAKPIDAFAFAPGLDRVAYTRVVADRGEEAPDASVCELVVYDLAQRSVRAVTRPDTATGDSPRIAGWLDADRLVLERVSGFDVAGMELWNPRTGAREPWLAGERENASDWAVAYGTLWYTSDDGVGPTFRTTLHARDLRTGETRDVTSRRSVVGPAPTAGGERVAFVNVDFAHGRDSVWVHELATGRERCVYAGPVGGKSAGFLQWAPDGRRLAVCYEGRGSFVLDCTAGAARPDSLGARLVAWTPAGDMLVMRGGGLRLRHGATGREEPLLRDGTDAVVLGP